MLSRPRSPARVEETCSWKEPRFGSLVSASCRARKLRRASTSRRSVTSCMVPLSPWTWPPAPSSASACSWTNRDEPSGRTTRKSTA